MAIKSLINIFHVFFELKVYFIEVITNILTFLLLIESYSGLLYNKKGSYINTPSTLWFVDKPEYNTAAAPMECPIKYVVPYL